MNLIEISNKFPSELEAIKFLERKRWGKEIHCPYCNSKDIGNRQQDLRYYCKNCSRIFSVTVGTQLHDTRLPVKTWIYAVAIITDAKKGLSAMQLQRNLGIHYETAWTMYHKIRELMGNENKNIELDGVLEMDETFVGGKPRRFVTGKTTPPDKQTKIPALDKKIQELKDVGINLKRGRGNPAKPDINPKRGMGTNKFKVAGIVERNGNVVAEVMKNLSYTELKKLVEKYVAKEDSIVITDEKTSYNKFHKIIEHIQINHKQLYSYKGVNTNSIESFWAIIKRRIIGQYHQVSLRHLPNYVAEFVYKYNNRNDNDFMFDELIDKLIIPINR